MWEKLKKSNIWTNHNININVLCSMISENKHKTEEKAMIEPILRLLVIGLSGFFGFSAFFGSITGSIIIAIASGIIGFLIIVFSGRTIENKKIHKKSHQ